MSFDIIRAIPLGEVATIKGGKRLPKGSNLSSIKNNHPYIKVKDMKNGKIIRLNNEFEYVEEEAHKRISRYTVNENDLILSIVGTVGLVSKVDITLDKANLTENCVKIINLKNIDTDYLYYYLTSPDGKHEMIKGTVGSTQPKLPMYNIKKLPIPLLSLKEQKRIANTLSKLDEKIEVNNQINETLEKMAQELFKRWFVDFEFPDENGNPYQSSGGEMVNSELGMIPKGWEFSRLDSIANITMGQSPKGTSYNETGNGIIFYQGRTDFRKRYPQKRMYTTEPKRTAEKGDILMSVRAPVGDINIANEKCCIGRGLAALNSKEKSNSFLLYTLINLRNKFNVFNGEGTVFGSINQLSLKSIKVIKPSNYYMRSFEKVVSKIDEKYYFSAKESRRLVNVRDTLLPKLMSGELRVSLEETEEVTAEVKGG